MNTEMTTRETELLAANAALELEVVRLRNALEQIKLRSISLADAQVVALEALSTPFTPTALAELIEKVEKMTIERCAEHLSDAYGIEATRCELVSEIRALPNVTLEDLL